MIESFEHLKNVFRDGARSAFEELRARLPHETIYAFALYTDDDGVATSVVANTEESLQRKLDRGGVEENEVMHYRWDPAEWEYEGIETPAFPSRDDMEEFAERWERQGKSYRSFRGKVFASMVDALKDLDRAGVFGEGAEREAITAFVAISDSDESALLEDRSARAINPSKVARRFRQRCPWYIRWLAYAAAYMPGS